jgi:hypothetical protein
MDQKYLYGWPLLCRDRIHGNFWFPFFRIESNPMISLPIHMVHARDMQSRVRSSSINRLKAKFLPHIVTYTGYVCGNVTNNSTTRVRIGYRIYSLWRFITTHRFQLLATDTITHNYYCTLNDLTRLITATLLNTGFRLL